MSNSDMVDRAAKALWDQICKRRGGHTLLPMRLQPEWPQCVEDACAVINAIGHAPPQILPVDRWSAHAVQSETNASPV